MNSATLEIRSLSKSFGANAVLRDVSLELNPGSVLGLCGENGAGKSTLMRCMSGFLRQDSGEILCNGAPISSPEERRQMCRLVPQEFHLVPQMTVAENLFLGREKRRGVFVDSGSERDEARRALTLAGAADLDVDEPVSTLGVAQKQKVEIARGFLHRTPVLLFDEPTTVLGEEETAALVEIVRRFRDSGGAVMWVSHKLGEVLSICDEVAVLRDGSLVARKPARCWTVESLAEAMVGRPLSRLYPPKRQAATGNAGGKDGFILEAKNLSDGGRVRNASIAVRKGEILGLAGLAGSGRTELAHLLCGFAKPVSGTISLDGKQVSFSSVADSLGRGVAYLTEDRQGEGILPEESVEENMALSSICADTAGPFVSGSRRHARMAKLADSLKIDISKLPAPVRTLSGGNQQKTVLARTLAAKPRVLIVDEPTRGVDIGARAEIYAALRDLAISGMAIIAISSEMDEIVGLSDRVVVMHDGISSEPLEGDAVSDRDIVRLAHGLSAASGERQSRCASTESQLP